MWKSWCQENTWKLWSNFFYFEIYLVTCLPGGPPCQMQFQWQGQAGSSDLGPNPDWTRRSLSDCNQRRRHWMNGITDIFILYLGGSTLVPGAVIKDVLPLLEDQNEVEIGCLKNINYLSVSHVEVFTRCGPFDLICLSRFLGDSLYSIQLWKQRIQMCENAKILAFFFFLGGCKSLIGVFSGKIWQNVDVLVLIEKFMEFPFQLAWEHLEYKSNISRLRHILANKFLSLK